MSMRFKLFLPILALFLSLSAQEHLLIPMDRSQYDHLKAYGLVYFNLDQGRKARWLLNYRKGSFVIPYTEENLEWALERQIHLETATEEDLMAIEASFAGKNQYAIKLEKAPKVAIYTPPDTSPWADAVTLAMTYAEIPYDQVYDRQVLAGELDEYDWLHLHHEDFSGQYSKFWAKYRHADWFQSKRASMEREAREAGFAKVSEHKAAVATRIRESVEKGIYLFAMCTATETLDIALAANGLDIQASPFDGDPVQSEDLKKLNYQTTMAFENFSVEPSPYKNSFSDIDYNQVNTADRIEVSDFLLFEFSAELDPIPSLLNQNHKNKISGFYGQTTTFRKDKLKDGVLVLAESENGSARYIHAVYGKGTITYYGGHAPDDKSHFVGDQAPDLSTYKNSPGYRLILNNVLFPSAKPPKKKT